MLRKAMLSTGLIALCFGTVTPLWAEDPFAGGEDALAVAEEDGSSSLRAKKKMTKMEADMVVIKVKSVEDAQFPRCTILGEVIKPASSTDKQFKLMGKSKTYRFLPELKMKGAQVELKDEMTQNNLGACYYPRNTKLVVKVSGVDVKAKVFNVSELYLQ